MNFLLQTCRSHEEDIINNNGERLIEACYQQSLMIKNVWFRYKNIHKYIQSKSCQIKKSIIDHLIKRQTNSWVSMFKYVVVEYGSGKNLVDVKIKFLFLVYGKKSLQDLVHEVRQCQRANSITCLSFKR